MSNWTFTFVVILAVLASAGAAFQVWPVVVYFGLMAILWAIEGLCAVVRRAAVSAHGSPSE